MDQSTNYSISWKKLPWKKFEARTFNLQCRIYRAVTKGNVKQAIKLQKLLITSLSTHYIAIREITESNKLCNISGIDKNIVNTDSKKIDILLKINKNINSWVHSALKKVEVNENNTKFFFNIPTIEDRIVQYIWRLALEPAQEALFFDNLYICKQKLNNWDIQKSITFALSQLDFNNNNKILKITLNQNFNEKGDFFYKNIVKHLIFPAKYKSTLFKVFKLGILKENIFKTPYSLQKILIAPILINTVLHSHLNKNTGYEKIITRNIKFHLRYANELLLVINSQKDNEQIIELINNIQKKSGSDLKIRQLKILGTKYNFEFLDWTFNLKKNGKAISYPSRKNWLNYKDNIKRNLRNSKYNIEKRIQILKEISKKWYFYNKYCDMSKMSGQLYLLRKWYSFFIRRNTKIIKEERIKTLKDIFIKSKN